MIFVDYRAGSHELLAPLVALGLTVEETTLPFGDLAWEGRGEAGKTVQVGIEFKKLEELVTAIRTNRLVGHQAVGMRPMFDYSYLLIEGELVDNKRGQIGKWAYSQYGRRVFEPFSGKMTMIELLKRVNVIHLRGGLNPIWSPNRKTTLQHIHALYRTWTDTDLDKHKSHLGIYVPPSIIQVSPMRRALSTFPHIGRRTSLAVEQRFGSLERACTATVDEWASIQTTDDKGNKRKIGTKVAEQIVEFCRGVHQ